MYKKLGVLIFLALVVGLLIFVFSGRDDSPEMETVKVEKTDLQQSVEETGYVRAQKNIKLSFERAGVLSQNLVSVGDKVDQGQSLAELNHNTLTIQEREAEIAMEAAETRLEKLRTGASQSDIQVAESQLKQAQKGHESSLEELEEVKKTVAKNIRQAEEHLKDLKTDQENDLVSYRQALRSAEKNLEDTKKTQQEQVDKSKEAVLSTTNSGISGANSALDSVNEIIDNKDLENKGVLSVKNSHYLRQTERYYEQSQDLRREAREIHDQAKQESSKENVELLLEKTLDLLEKTFETLDYCYLALQNSVTSSEFPKSQLDSYKKMINERISAINSAINSSQSAKHSLEGAHSSYEVKVRAAENALKEVKSNLNDAIKSAENSLESATVSGEHQITSAQNQVSSAKEAVRVAESQLEQIKSPARQEDIRLAEKEVEQARLALNLVQENIKNSIITAPISGEINRVNFEPGEQIPPQSPAIEMGDNENLRIKVHISEIDINKISIGDRVSINLDAFDRNKDFYGEVVFIDPSETNIQDIIYYETTIDFTEENDPEDLERMRPGMTADITVFTESKEGVLAIPNRAIIEKTDGQRIVRVLKESGEIEERGVEVGLRGDGGLTEILEGLEEGEEVITYIEE